MTTKSEPAISRKGQKEQSKSEHILGVNIYGPPDLSDPVGEFASQCQLFLQDPVNCDRNVVYLNPHRMPFEDVMYTASLPMLLADLAPPKIEIRHTQDLFRDFELDEELAETDPPHIVLKSTLQSYVAYLPWHLQRLPVFFTVRLL